MQTDEMDEMDETDDCISAQRRYIRSEFPHSEQKTKKLAPDAIQLRKKLYTLTVHNLSLCGHKSESDNALFRSCELGHFTRRATLRAHSKPESKNFALSWYAFPKPSMGNATKWG